MYNTSYMYFVCIYTVFITYSIIFHALHTYYFILHYFFWSKFYCPMKTSPTTCISFIRVTSGSFLFDLTTLATIYYTSLQQVRASTSAKMCYLNRHLLLFVFNFPRIDVCMNSIYAGQHDILLSCKNLQNKMISSVYSSIFSWKYMYVGILSFIWNPSHKINYSTYVQFVYKY